MSCADHVLGSCCCSPYAIFTFGVLWSWLSASDALFVYLLWSIEGRRTRWPSGHWWDICLQVDWRDRYCYRMLVQEGVVCSMDQYWFSEFMLLLLVSTSGFQPWPLWPWRCCKCNGRRWKREGWLRWEDENGMWVRWERCASKKRHFVCASHLVPRIKETLPAWLSRF